MQFNYSFLITTLFFVSIDFTLADPLQCRPEGEPNNDINRRIVYLERNNDKFFAVISLGVPLQDFNVAIDFNSAVLWVPGSDCPCADECKQTKFCKENCGEHCCEQNLQKKRIEASALTGKCTRKLAFRVNKSRLYMETQAYLRVKYSGEDLLTFVSLDQMSFGSRNAPGITIPHVEFGLLKEFPASYENAVNDGVLGLAITDKNGNQSIMKQLLHRKIISHPIITIWINNGKGDLQLVDGSMTIGEIDQRVCDDTTKSLFKLASLDQWAFLLTEAFIKDERFGYSKISIDLEASKLVVPHNVLTFIKKLCEAQMDKSTGDLIGMCTETTLKIKQGTTVIETSLINFMTRYDNQYCVINIREATPQDPSEWVLNAGVTKDYCIILDYSGYLGFVPIKTKAI